MRRPTILLVGNFLSLEGANRSVGEELAKHLEGAGYRVIVSSHKRSRLLRLLDMVSTAWMRRMDYQVAYIEVYSGMAFLWAETVSRVLMLIKKPYLLALHGGNLPTFAQRWPQRVERLLKSAKVVVAPSDYLMQEMQLYRRDIFLIPNAIELELYPFRLRSKPTIRLIWLRAFHNIYNPQMAPLVIAKLRQTFPEITLTMLGPDKGDGALQEVQNQVEKLGLHTNIEIIAGIPKSQVPGILEQGDIFINTTTIDNAPVSIIEAMACGLCIVSTNVGGIPFLLKDGEDALLVPTENPLAMSNAIVRILSEPGLAEKLSSNARRKAQQFNWETILLSWENRFQEILDA